MAFNSTTDEIVLKLQTPVGGKPMGSITPWIALLEILRQQGVVDYTLSGTTPGDNSKPWLDTVNKQLKCFNSSTWDVVDIGAAFPVFGRRLLARYGGDINGGTFSLDNTMNYNSFIGAGGPALGTGQYNIWYNEIDPLDYNLKGKFEIVNYIDKSMFPLSGGDPMSGSGFNSPANKLMLLGFKPSHNFTTRIHFYNKIIDLNTTYVTHTVYNDGNGQNEVTIPSYLRRFDVPYQMFDNILNIFPFTFRYEICDIQTKFGKITSSYTSNGQGSANSFRVVELYKL